MNPHFTLPLDLLKKDNLNSTPRFNCSGHLDSFCAPPEDETDRALTAPARPLTEIEDFRRSNKFGIIELIVISS